MRGQDGVGYGGGFSGRAYVVNPYQMGSGQYGGGCGCQRGVSPAPDRHIHAFVERGQGFAQKTFARGACEQGLTKGSQLFQAGEQGVVLVVNDAETEARVEDYLLPLDSRFQRLL